MDSNKTSIQIGDFHLETEGSEAAVDKRIDSFKQMIEIATKAGLQASDRLVRPKSDMKKDAESSGASSHGEASSPLRKLFREDGRIISLEIKPQGGNSESDAFLLLLLGQKIMRGEDLVPVGELLEGVKRSGFGAIKRMDEITAKVSTDLWNKVGERRAGKFRLMIPGEKKAREIAQELVSQMA